MTGDQLKLVLELDDQHVKIKTVIGIDDHSDGEHAKPKMRLKARLAEVIEIAGDVQLPVTATIEIQYKTRAR
jgi:hypothetical protein